MSISLAGRILDAPALLDLASRRSHYMRALAAVFAQRGHTLAVPATTLAQAGVLAGERGVQELAWAIESASVIVIPLDDRNALDVAATAREAALDGDVLAAQVAHASRQRGWPVITSPANAPRWRALGIDAETLP